MDVGGVNMAPHAAHAPCSKAAVVHGGTMAADVSMGDAENVYAHTEAPLAAPHTTTAAGSMPVPAIKLQLVISDHPIASMAVVITVTEALVQAAGVSAGGGAAGTGDAANAAVFAIEYPGPVDTKTEDVGMGQDASTSPPASPLARDAAAAEPAGAAGADCLPADGSPEPVGVTQGVSQATECVTEVKTEPSGASVGQEPRRVPNARVATTRVLVAAFE